jgi:hypothetical protein
MWSMLERKLKFMFVRLTLCYETFVWRKRKSNPSLDAKRNQAQILVFYFQFIYWHQVLGMG